MSLPTTGKRMAIDTSGPARSLEKEALARSYDRLNFTTQFDDPNNNSVSRANISFNPGSQVHVYGRGMFARKPQRGAARVKGGRRGRGFWGKLKSGLKDVGTGFLAGISGASNLPIIRNTPVGMVGRLVPQTQRSLQVRKQFFGKGGRLKKAYKPKYKVPGRLYKPPVWNDPSKF